MSKRDYRRVRLAFEPNRFSSEQLVKVYEQLKPIESRTKTSRAVGKAAGKKPTSVKAEQS